MTCRIIKVLLCFELISSNRILMLNFFSCYIFWKVLNSSETVAKNDQETEDNDQSTEHHEWSAWMQKDEQVWFFTCC